MGDFDEKKSTKQQSLHTAEQITLMPNGMSKPRQTSHKEEQYLSSPMHNKEKMNQILVKKQTMLNKNPNPYNIQNESFTIRLKNQMFGGDIKDVANLMRNVSTSNYSSSPRSPNTRVRKTYNFASNMRSPKFNKNETFEKVNGSVSSLLAEERKSAADRFDNN